jgi:hypothetical protein
MARPYCGARSRSGGECHRPAGWGTDSDIGRCKLHGEATPTHRKYAQTETLRREVERLGIPVEADPPRLCLRHCGAHWARCFFCRAGRPNSKTRP